MTKRPEDYASEPATRADDAPPPVPTVPAGGAPDVSVVIPTHNRAGFITRTLDALARQTYPAGRMEVIVVADGCTDDTDRVVRTYAETAPYALRVVEQSGTGPAQARNAGAHAARGRLLVFLDDDIEATPQLVQAHVEARAGRPCEGCEGHRCGHEYRRELVVLGYLPTRLYDQKGYYRALLRSSWEDVFNHMRAPGHRFTYRDLLTGNVSVDRSLFTAVGGFDVGFRCHEDWEFGYRLLKAGAQFVFAEAAAGYHHERTAMERSFRRKTAEGIADVQLGGRHPDLLRDLHLAKLKAACATSEKNRRARATALLHRAVRDVALYHPAAANRAADRAIHLLAVFERLRIRRRWHLLLQLLLVYHYWRGVAQLLPTVAAIEEFLDGAPEVEYDRFPTVDLQQGLDAVTSWIDRERPVALRVTYGENVIGLVYPEPGAEPLRGVHLREKLARDFSQPTLWHLIDDGVVGNQPVAPVVGADRDEEAPDADVPEPYVAPSCASEQGVPFPWPVHVSTIDISKPIEPVALNGSYIGARLLVCERGRPAGWIWLDWRRAPYSAAELGAEVESQLRGVFPIEMLPSVAADSLPAVTVVVCTRNRPESLKRTLDALAALDYQDYEVVVVDNGSVTGDTCRAVLQAGPRFRYVREDRPGLDWARNRGIAEARHGIVAFTDDDACPHPGWLRAVASAFNAPEVMAASGYVTAAELSTKAQVLFELVYGGMGHGLRPRVYRRDSLSGRDLLWASRFGVGANMAFRRCVFDSVGAFDTALDVGTPSAGGGDVEMFHRLVARGHTLVYEPAMIVWHYHRPGMEDLRRLVYQNGRSFGAYLMTCFRNRTVGRATVLRFAASWFGSWILWRLVRPAGMPREFVLAELRGALYSPIAYRKSRHVAVLVAKNLARGDGIA